MLLIWRMKMATGDWYRNNNWNAEIEEKFFEKLSKSRSQRDQYIVIQAITLARKKPQAALNLIELYYNTKTTNYHDDQALLTRIDAHKTLGDESTVLSLYKNALALDISSINFKLDFIFYVTAKHIETEYKAAYQLLPETLDDLVFIIDEFRWNFAKAILVYNQGNSLEATKYALKAIELSKIEKSGFKYHPSIGLVDKKYNYIIRILKDIIEPTRKEHIKAISKRIKQFLAYKKTRK